MEETGFHPGSELSQGLDSDLVGKIQREVHFLTLCQSLEAWAQVPVLDFMSSLNPVACLKTSPLLGMVGLPYFCAAEPL